MNTGGPSKVVITVMAGLVMAVPTSVLPIASGVGAGEANLSTEYQPGVTIIETNGWTVVSEDGTCDWYEIVLNTRPMDNVVILVDPDEQVDLGAGPGG